jgi:catenin alpha
LTLNHYEYFFYLSQIPEKKPLVRREVPEEVRAKVRRGSQKRAANPIKALSEFQNPDDETI